MWSRVTEGRRGVGRGATAVLCVVLGFVCGRWAAPVGVETRAETERWRERHVETSREAEVRETAEAQRRVLYRERVTFPDGAVHERELDRTEREAHSSALVHVERVHERDTEAMRHVEVARRDDGARAEWRAGVLAGWSVPSSVRPGVGLMLERKLLGPLSVGAWVLAAVEAHEPLSGGVLVAVEF